MKLVVCGGISSGKSEVVNILKNAGFSVISADEINRGLLAESDYISKLSNLFPQTVINGVFSKQELRKLIVKDELSRKKLNALAHPLILKKIAERLAVSVGDIVIEIPLYVESGAHNIGDYVVYVDAPIDYRAQRLAVRDELSIDEAYKLIAAQAVEANARNIADAVISNCGNLEDLKFNVMKTVSDLKCRTE